MALGRKRWKGVPAEERRALAMKAAEAAGRVHAAKAAARRKAKLAEIMEPDMVEA